MIKIFSELSKGNYEIIAVASHQKDLNNLRLMSYELNDGKDKIQLNKDKYSGAYLKIKCETFKSEAGGYDVAAMNAFVSELQTRYGE